MREIKNGRKSVKIIHFFQSKNILDSSKVPAYVPSAYVSKTEAKRQENLTDEVGLFKDLNW